MPVAFVPLTQAPTHVGAFRQPVPATATAAPAPLPDVPFPIRIEAAFGANPNADPSSWTWTDISADARRMGGVNLRRGRPDERGQTIPTQVSFTLNNKSGNYTPRNALGAYYPYVRQNTPIRVSVYAVGQWNVRAIVYADTWTAGWDQAFAVPTVAISASGTLRLLAQGGTLNSALYRSITSSAPTAYWPLEDGTGATQATSGLTGGTPLVVTGTTPGFGQTSFPGSAPIANMSGGGQLSGVVKAGNFVDRWRIEWVGAYKVGTTPSAGQLSIAVQFHTTGTFSRWGFTTGGDITPVTMRAFFEKPDGSGNTSLGSNDQVYDGVARHFRLDAFQSGTQIDVTLSINGVTAIHYVGALSTGTLGQITDVQINPGAVALAYAPSVGHLAVWQPWSGTTNTAAAATGYSGELASARLTRLGAERGISALTVGTSTSAMGAQSITDMASLLRECEVCDGGLLGDGLTGGVKLLTAPARYNRAADLILDVNLRQLPADFQPIEDDQRRRNDWTVTRSGSGSSSRVIDSIGPQGTNNVGVYSDSATVNVATDATTLNHAGWRVHLGTVEQMRYPTVSLNLRANPELISQWVSCDLGSRVTLKNLPTQHQPGDLDLIIEGYTEFCDSQRWAAGLSTSTFDPWRAFVIGDPVLGKIDSDNSILRSTLAALAAGTVDSFSVDVLAGPLWTTTATYPADFPFDIGIDGERITVTGITGTSSPQTFTVTRATNGVVKTHAIGAAVNLWTRPGIAL